MDKIFRIILVVLIFVGVIDVAKAAYVFPCGGAYEQTVSDEEKMELADLVIEGKMASYVCECPENQNVDLVSCKATINVAKTIKGNSAATVVYFDRHITAPDFSLDCKFLTIKGYSDSVQRDPPPIYYLYRDKGGLYEGTYIQVPRTKCLPAGNIVK